MKYHKLFLAYYAEKLRSTRFIDLGKRYDINKYIVQNTSEIDIKGSLNVLPNYNLIDDIIKNKKLILSIFKEILIGRNLVNYLSEKINKNNTKKLIKKSLVLLIQ